MNIIAKIYRIFEEQQVSANFTKREFVVEYAENIAFPQHIKFQLSQDKCSLIDEFSEGEIVDISFNLRGREWINPKGESVYLNSLEAWKITRASQEQNQTHAKPAAKTQNAAYSQPKYQKYDNKQSTKNAAKLYTPPPNSAPQTSEPQNNFVDDLPF